MNSRRKPLQPGELVFASGKGKCREGKFVQYREVDVFKHSYPRYVEYRCTHGGHLHGVLESLVKRKPGTKIKEVVLAAMGALLISTTPLAGNAQEEPFTTSLIVTAPSPPPQQERIRLANALLVEQAGDIVTSQLIFRRGGYERDPLASRNVLPEVVEAGLFQALARNPHTSLRLLKGAVYLYPLILGNNVRVLLDWRH